MKKKKRRIVVGGIMAYKSPRMKEPFVVFENKTTRKKKAKEEGATKGGDTDNQNGEHI